MPCPKCHSQSFVKNGFNATNKQMYRCRDCGRQFVLNPEKSAISDENKSLIDRLLLERLSLAAIARVVGVSKSWLQRYVNKKYESVPRQVEVKKSAGDDSRLSVMKCGHLYINSKINNGFGWRLILARVKLLARTLEIEVRNLHVDYGTLCLLFIANAQ